MNPTYIIDRIENDTAVCFEMPTNAEFHIKSIDLPENAKEGDIIKKTNTGYIVDREETKNRLDKLTKRMNKLFEKSKLP